MVVLKYVIAIIVLSIVILFHELGHFWLAKANGIRVNEFSLGLGPTLVGFTRGETKYSIKLLPFGGACMMEGEDEQSDDDRSFQKNWLHRVYVLSDQFVTGTLGQYIHKTSACKSTRYLYQSFDHNRDNCHIF